jgi:hypothetical protein
MEAEYIALCSAAKKAVWLREFLAELGFSFEFPIVIKADNQSAITLA